jgi:hypothetical protein
MGGYTHSLTEECADENIKRDSQVTLLVVVGYSDYKYISLDFVMEGGVLHRLEIREIF